MSILIVKIVTFSEFVTICENTSEKNSGCNVEVAYDGYAGKQLVETKAYNLIIANNN
jgi:hypothetical protein